MSNLIKKYRKIIILINVIIVCAIIFVVTNGINRNSIKSEGIDYIIDLDEFEINNKNYKAEATTKGINKALEYAKQQGYKKVKLPKGHYSIDTSLITPIVISDGNGEWTHNGKGIIMQSDMELIMTDVILEMVSTDDPYYSIFTISNCNNSKVTDGTILGDRDNHDFGMVINKEANELESGSYDENTGLPLEDNSMVRTKEFIDNLNGELLPNNFILTVLEKTSKNTVDGGVRYIYCYDDNEKYLGIASGGNGFLSKAQLLPNTAKIKMSFKDEQRLDAVYYITNELVYPTHEFGSGITITASNNIEIENVTIKNTIGDCILTMAPPLKVTVDNVKIINCTLENSRRQGISLVATGENYLIKGCNIGKINGTDPQCGIDIEHYDYVKNVVIEENNFYDNKKWDIINYNGQDIEIKNNKFTGGVASTFGWNMNIYNNEFEYIDTDTNSKIYPGVVFALNTNKTNEDKAYFKINNNSIKGYNNAGITSSLELSEFTDNKVYDTENLIIKSPKISKNIFENSNIRYCVPTVKNEYFKHTVVGIENDIYNTIIEECNFEESQFIPRKETIIRNCKINNKQKPFGETNGWWNLNSSTIFENCDIKAEYENNIQFFNNYCSNTLFKNCNMNLSRNLFCINYGVIEFDDCNMNFSNLNNNDNIIDFDKIVYGNKNNYWAFKNCTLKSELPIRINTKNIFDCKTEGQVIIIEN